MYSTNNYKNSIELPENPVQSESTLDEVRTQALIHFKQRGIPTVKHEEWKYTRISHLLPNDIPEIIGGDFISLTIDELAPYQLPEHDSANSLVFVNGIYASSLSNILSPELNLFSLEQAANNEFKEVVTQHLAHSAGYLPDGVNAMNTAAMYGGLFIHIAKGKTVQHPVYIYNISDSRSTEPLSLPRTLIYLEQNARIQMVETYHTLGNLESFTNQVIEMVVEQDAMLEYYKIQNDTAKASQVSTTHIRQTGKSVTHAVTVSLNGAVVRNNTNFILEKEYSEANLFGLYFQKGQTHVDNHTVVDHVAPNCLSNELYKGILDEEAVGVFNGKIFVRQDAQKTNAFQSNKNILLSPSASINTKPQLEIFADDVKCSHGCTIGRLDETGLFYLRSRGISEKTARSLLVNAFAIDILQQIKLEPIREFVQQLVAQRLQFNEL